MIAVSYVCLVAQAYVCFYISHVVIIEEALVAGAVGVAVTRADCVAEQACDDGRVRRVAAGGYVAGNFRAGKRSK